MTVSTTLDRQYFNGNGATVAFPFNFRFFSNDQIYVSLIAPDGTVTPQTLTTHYTLSGALQAGGGTVTMVAAPPLTVPATRVYVQRILAQSQPTSIRNQGAYFPAIHEDVFDRLTMLIQQALAGVGNALQLTFAKTGWNFLGYKGINVGAPTAPTDAATKGYVDTSATSNSAYTDTQMLRTVRVSGSETLTQLPPAASRANKVMGFDAAGNPLGILPSSGSGTELAIDLANTIDPNKGTGMLGHRGETVADTLNSLVYYARYAGVVGNGIVDDTANFLAACTIARAFGIPLNIEQMKINLPTLAASIDLDAGGKLEIIGEGELYVATDDWDVLRGTGNINTIVVPHAIAAEGAVIISTVFNGPVFTGKNLTCKNFAVLCNWANTSSCGFQQSTPTSYPGWAGAIRETESFGVYYAGTHGVEIKGGLEVADVKAINARFCRGHGLYIHGTAGIDSPIEYLEFLEGSKISSNLLANINLDGVRKHVKIGRIYLNDAGLIRLAEGGGAVAQGGILPTSLANLVPAIELGLTGISAPFNIEIDGAFAEYCNLVVKTTGNYTNNIQVQNVTQFALVPAASGWVWRTGRFTHTTSRNMRLRDNMCSLGLPTFNFTSHTATDNRVIIDNLTQTDGIGQIYISKDSLPFDPTSGTIGDGTAATFTSAFAQIFPSPSTAGNEGARAAVFMVTSNFQGSGSTSGGAYIMVVTKQNSGDYFGVVFAGGSLTGFSAAPSIATDGTISIPLAANFRARITRIDHTALSS